ncbi:MAG: DUF3365 domain-containing protein [Calditrichaeota bacterium]|jgi:hypothetical protein|nr:DUF3365 domain-containing protein [Calditrichota bacterium]MBT7618870.1 DUF3365 domain-containing protein [Calditrichota bacterium]MBT7788608.1 DUF3365 domain-containing protein [Calditrichota bacterium]
MDDPINSSSNAPLNAWKHGVIVAFFWTLFVTISVVWNLSTQKSEVVNSARIQAEAAWQKDVLYRRWSASHGGVYAPVTESTLPNPFLDVTHRDITTPDGRELTLINPAYMTRQVNEIGIVAFDIWGHITSLNPIRPENAPDPWETNALKDFEKGFSEVSSIVILNNKKRLRFMKPLFTEQGCLKCHAKQGYELGDIRGGISVSIPMTPLEENSRLAVNSMLVGHSFLWLLGLGGILFSTNYLNIRIRERTKLLADREKMILELKDAMDSVKVLGGLIPICANCKDIRDDKGYWKQIEEYIAKRSEAAFTHSICPKCTKELYPDFDKADYSS